MGAIGSLDFNSFAQALTALDRKHKFVLNLGGKGSGKTFTHSVWALERGQFDTGQLHGIFTNTEKQLKEGVLFELNEKLPLAGVQCDYGRRPPKSWFRRWAKLNIPIPPVLDYRGIFYTSDGLHALCGTLFNQGYKQYETLQFGSLRLEEIPAIAKEALLTMIGRLRCGKGANCQLPVSAGGWGHRHQAHLFGNPPVGPHPWLFDWLDQWEEGTKKLYHALEAGETCSCERFHGPQLNHRQWPLLRQGIGNAILVKSKTSDNRMNLNAGYEDDLAMNYDKTTAAAWLFGELTREVSAGCYDSFSDANVRSVSYDPNRTLYVCIDINTEPRVAVLAHPLLEGEYPSDWHQSGVAQVGVFGEFFHVGGLSDQRFAEAMMRGGRGGGEAGYPDEELRGLPANWQGLERHNGRIIFFGDADGNRKSVHDVELASSWSIMRRTFAQLRDVSYSVPENNPPARMRIHAVNAKLKNALGIPSLSIDPRCRHTLKDCESVVWDEKGLAEREWRQGPEILRTHCMAGLGYCLVELFPLGSEDRQSDEREGPRFNRRRIERPKLR